MLVVSFRHHAAGTSAAAWGPWISALEELDPLQDLVAGDRVVVVAAHPDDEGLGAGGLLHAARQRGLEVQVVVVTHGEHGHPALGGLAADGGSSVKPLLLGYPDGTVVDHLNRFTTTLVDIVGDGRRTLMVAPWRHDGHPDHEAAGAAAATAAQRTGARLVEYPIWFWRWAVPEQVSAAGFARLRLDAAASEAKARAVAAHRSRPAPLSDQPGEEVVLDDLLAHFLGPIETYVVQATHDTALEDLHRLEADPWGVEDRWYEQRKRDLVLAVLPRRRFRSGVEVGCSTGALTLALAQRCDSLVAVDASPSAIAAARARLIDQPHVELVGAIAPEGWPRVPGGVDLVVLSEVGYFLSPADLDRLAARVRADLTEDGTVLLCHWRHEIEGWVMNAAEVHARAVAGLGLPVLATYADRDVELLLLGALDQLPEPSASGHF